MYEAFYQLRMKPFSIVPDPDFLYWAGPHTLAFAMLEYGIQNRAGFTVITGEIGAGKTTLIMNLLNCLPGDVTVGFVSNTQSDHGDLLNWIMMSLSQEFDGLSYARLYKRFEEFLKEQHARGRRIVLIIDEAQNLGARALEELRMMSNMNTSRQELLQIILTGQPELKALLGRPELRQFAQRVSSDFHLNLLSSQDVPAYIDHRLKVAGAQRNLFTEEATRLIYEDTRGTPRLINILCDTALMYGFATEADEISEDLVKAVVRDKRQFGVFAPTSQGTRPEHSLTPILHEDFGERRACRERRKRRGVIGVQFQAPLLAALDRFIAGEENALTRPGAVRLLLTAALQELGHLEDERLPTLSFMENGGPPRAAREEDRMSLKERKVRH
jgi:type II secretory pathway predicted ATPase ExeA